MRGSFFGRRGSLAQVLVIGGSLVACVASDSDPESSTNEGATSNGPRARADAGNEAGPGANCNFEESSQHPQISVTGDVCGETISYASGAGRSLHFGRTSLEQPAEQVRVISLKDDPDHGNVTDDAYFEEFGLVLNLALATGFELADGVSTHLLQSGLFASCDFGTLVLAQTPVTIEIEGVEPGTRQGDVRLTLHDVVVKGYSERYSLRAVPACGGEVDIVVEGPFQHR